MSKCLVTGKETVQKTKNLPLSREGREELKLIKNKYNEKLKEKFVESYKEKASNISEDAIESVSKLAPRVSGYGILQMLGERTLEELFGEFDKKEEESDVQQD